jgi:DNA-binding response OmpR family regulator
MADILLVDNDARLSELMSWFLKKRGHEVRTALSYAEARERIAEREPGLMLADLELGRERGREELARMHRESRLPRTVVVSGYLDRETEESLSELTSIVGMLRKPFALEDLEAMIEACSRESRATEEHPRVQHTESNPEAAAPSIAIVSTRRAADA